MAAAPHGDDLRPVSPTERENRRLEHSQRLLDALYRGNLAGLIESTEAGTILDCNDAFARMLGYDSRDELKLLNAGELYYVADERRLVMGMLEVQKQMGEFELCLRRRDGSPCWVLVNISQLDPLPEESGRTFLSTVFEITERKKWEDTLRRNEERFAAFMGHLPGVAFIKDISGRYVYYNEACRSLFGKAPEEFIGRTDPELWPAPQAAEYQHNDAAVVATGSPLEVLESVVHPEGIRTWLFYKFPITDAGRIAFVGGIGIDATERLALQDQLAQARKMEALGRLAGGVAHDFNNLLTVISGYCQLAQESVGQETESSKMALWLREIMSSSRRAAALTGQLLAFSRREPMQTRIFNLGELLDGMTDMLRRLLGETVDLRIRSATTDICLVRADPNQIEQAIVNLAVNARDAMPLGGMLEIRCATPPTPPERTSLAKGAVLLEVSDTGVGMDEQFKAHLFEPFFTSKPTGKGTGLGLSTVYGVVSQAGGEIDVSSEPGCGTTFRIWFPLASGPVESVLSSGSVPAGHEIILLVEDESNLKNLAQTILRRLGYTVHAAGSAVEALLIWKELDGHIDLLLTDVIMPQMSGGELAHVLREKDPHLKVLFVSGYTQDRIASYGVLTGETQFLQKPFTAESLGRKVREVLDVVGGITSA